MTILALEFSSSQRSVAMARDGHVLGAAAETGGRAANAFGLIEKVLAASKLGREEIGCIAVGLGPGSYAGIRGSLAIAQGWQLARGIKLLGVDSFECLTAEAQARKIFGRVNVIIDAQRNEFYLAIYEVNASSIQEIAPLKIATMMEIQSRVDQEEILLGPDVTSWFPQGINLFPQATTLANLAAVRTDFVAGEKLEPIYLRAANFIKAPQPRPALS